ncbi:MAG: YihY/virulence factor BrkB family protein [Bacillota bacterium]|nr:YihY/virulence factor BrkB family protein [Bacillota bacterium]
MAKIRTRIIKMFILGFKQFQDPYYQGFAAQISFYLLLSIVPIFLLITQILGFFDISLGSAIKMVEQYTGKEMSSMLERLFEFSSVGYGNIIFALIALWAGSRASFAIMRITNYTLTEGQSTGKNYFVERIRAIKTMIITISTIVFSLLILAYGKLILEAVLGILGINADNYVDSIWMWLRWILGFALYFLMVSYNYYILPTEKVPFRKVLPGSIFASVGMLLVTVAYSKYANSLADYDLIYGALSSVVAIMFWFFFLAWVLCLGVLCNKVWDETSQSFSKRNPPEHHKYRHQSHHKDNKGS